MKRTSFLDLSAMRKRTRAFVLAPISLAVMTACSGPQEEQVNFVSSVEDCTNSTELSLVECEAAYAQAVKDAEATSPRYQYEQDCANEFGSCQRSSSGGFFMPFMAGYIVSGIVGNIGNSMDRKNRYNNSYPTYLYRGNGQYNNKIMTADGYVVGSPGSRSYNVSRDALKPKPAVTRTISRGGFGAKASAKSNWGSSKSKSGSRSSRSWGG